MRKLGQRAEGLKLLEQAVGRSPGQRTLLVAYAQALFMENEFQKLDTLIAGMPTGDLRQYMMALHAVGTQRYDQAYELLKRTEKTPTNKWLLARVTYSLGRYRESYSILNDLLQDPERRRTRRIVVALLALEQKEKVERAPQFASFWQDLSESQRQNFLEDVVLFNWGDPNPVGEIF